MAACNGSPLCNVSKTPFLIGVAGGTAAGKSSVCEKIMERLDHDYKRKVAMIAQDSFYRELNGPERDRAFKGDFNFDHPDAFDHSLMFDTLARIKACQAVQIPCYDYCTHSRKPTDSKTILPADVVIVEGILVFYDEQLRSMFGMKLFVDADPDIRLARRVMRDTTERGRDLSTILHQYMTYVKPAYEEFCLPTKKYADVIIPRGADNEVAINLIVQHIQELLRPSRNSSPALKARNRHSSETAMTNGR